MNTRIIPFIATILLTALAAFAADDDYDVASKLLQAGKCEEALVLFTNLATTVSGEARQADVLDKAAICAQRLKQYDGAMKLAARIPIAPWAKTVQMRIMLERGQIAELIAQFGNEEIGGWPANVQGEAYYTRGQAFYRVKDGLRAEADLTQAIVTLPRERERVQSLATLAATYRDLLHDNDKATQTYLEAQTRAFQCDRWGYTFFTVSTDTAALLASQGRYAEALAVLDTVDVKSLRGYWRAYILNAYGATYAAQGKLADAVACYQESADVEGAPAGMQQAARKRIDELVQQLAAPDADPADLVIALNGACDYQLVLPDAYPDPVIETCLTNAANLVRDAFAANGFALPVVAESARDPGRPALYLGNTAFARSHGADLAALPLWGYRHKAVGRDVIIAGHDRPCPVPPPEGGWRSRTQGQPELGTMKAVSDFLRIYVGTRFLYPGATGIEFLAKPVIAVPKDLDELHLSPVRFNVSYFQQNTPYFIGNNYLFYFNRGFWNWESSIPAETYRDTRPEYFALSNGQRCVLTKDWTGKWAEQYCLSNPDVRELIYQGLLAQADRGFDVISMNHPDGFLPCQCDDCRALYGTGNDWCEKVWIFYRGMAERLHGERPGRNVEFYAYGPTAAPPKTFDAFPENTGIMLCTTTPESFAAWNRIRVPRGFSAYLYNWGSWQMQECMPKRSAAYVARQVKSFYSNHVNGVSIDGFGESFGLDGPSYYVYGRMFDDPEETQADLLMDEFCTAAFREGAAPMKRFFAELHHALESSYLAARYQEPDGRWRKAIDDPMHYFSYVYPPGRLAAMESHLAEAERLVVAEKARRRLTLVRLEFDVLKSTLTVIQFYNAFQMRPDPASREGLLQALDERNALIDALFVRSPSGKLGGKKPIPGWPDMSPFRPCGRADIGLYGTRQRASYKGLFEMDTAAMRAAPLPGVSRLAVKAATTPVTIDAPQWADATATNLVRLPGNTHPTPATSFKAMHDRDNLYLRMESELPGPLTNLAPVVRDGQPAPAEALDIALDPSGHDRLYYRFIVGPSAEPRYDAARGLITDELHPSYGKEDPTWSGPWTYETRLEPDQNRWTALLTIPFNTLGVTPPAEGTVWRGNIGRTHVVGTDQTEQSTWSARPGTKDVTDTSAFGEIVF